MTLSLHLQNNSRQLRLLQIVDSLEISMLWAARKRIKKLEAVFLLTPTISAVARAVDPATNNLINSACLCEDNLLFLWYIFVS